MRDPCIRTMVSAANFTKSRNDTHERTTLSADHVVNAMIRTTVYISKTSSPMRDVNLAVRFRQGFFEMVFAASIRHIADSDAVERLAWNPDCACHESSSA